MQAACNTVLTEAAICSQLLGLVPKADQAYMHSYIPKKWPTFFLYPCSLFPVGCGKISSIVQILSWMIPTTWQFNLTNQPLFHVNVKLFDLDLVVIGWSPPQFTHKICWLLVGFVSEWFVHFLVFLLCFPCIGLRSLVVICSSESPWACYSLMMTS
jgi:hypothetical protein